MDDCIFCKIATGGVPSQMIASDENFVAILDINPISPGHTLIIPKTHCVTMNDMPEGIANAFFPFAQRVLRAVVHGTEAQGANLLVNSGKAAGQEVMHFHAHIIPRTQGDNALKFAQTGAVLGMYTEDIARRVAAAFE